MRLIKPIFNLSTTAIRAGSVIGGGPSLAIIIGCVPVHGLHATLLHALGLDHQSLTWPHNGRPGSLTDVAITKAHVVPELLA